MTITSALQVERVDVRRQTHEGELRHLQEDLLILGNMVETAIVKSVESLGQRDFESVERLASQTRLINKKQFTIETGVFTLLADRQWPAVELRTLTATLEIAAELERLGDYASGIARIGVMTGTRTRSNALTKVSDLAETVRDRLHRALRAFVQQDAKLAQAIARERDEAVIIRRVRRHLLANDASSSHAADHSSDLWWVTYKLQRIADRVTNICGWAIFAVTGEMTPDVEIDKPRSV